MTWLPNESRVPVPREASEDHGTVPGTAGTVPGTAGIAHRGRRMVLWRFQPKRGEEAALAIAVFQPLSQMHLDVRKGIHLLSPCSNTAAIPACLFDGKLTETAERRLAARATGTSLLCHPVAGALCRPGRGKLRRGAALRFVLDGGRPLCCPRDRGGAGSPLLLLPALGVSCAPGTSGVESCKRLKMRRKAPAGPLIHFPDI